MQVSESEWGVGVYMCVYEVICVYGGLWLVCAFLSVYVGLQCVYCVICAVLLYMSVCMHTCHMDFLLFL